MNFIDTNNLQEDMTCVGKINYTFNAGEFFLLYIKEKTVYILRKYPAKPKMIRGKLVKTKEPGYNLGQFELPVTALPGLIDTIENKFWKKASEGGLPGDVLHVDAIIDEEDLRVRFSPNCGDEGIQGFTFENYSRNGRSMNWQEMQIPYTLLREDGLLDLLKSINQKYALGNLDD